MSTILLYSAHTPRVHLSTLNKNEDQVDCCLNNYITPHPSIFSNIKAKTLSEIDGLGSFIHHQTLRVPVKDSNANDDNDSDRLITATVKRKADISEDSLIALTQEPNQSRNLAPLTCRNNLNNGIATTEIANVYMRNSTEVS